MVERSRSNHTLGSYPIWPVTSLSVGGMLGAISLWFSPWWALAMVGIALVMPIALKRPEIAMLGILVTTSSIVYEKELPLLPVGVGSLHIADVILLACLGLIFIRAMTEPGFKVVLGPQGAPLLLFLLLAVASTLLAIFGGGTSFASGTRELRIPVHYLSFFAAANLLQEYRQIRLFVKGLLFLAALVAAVMIAQFLLGDSFQLLPGRVETLSTQGAAYQGITRIIPPGQSLVLTGFILVTATLVHGRFHFGRSMLLLLWGLLGLGVIMTFSRTYWIGAILATVIIALLAGKESRKRLAGWIGLSLAAAGLIFIASLAFSDSLPARLISASGDRISTLGSSDILEETSLRDRFVENSYAIPQLLSHPILGIGMGSRYRPLVQGVDWERFDGRGYIHNGHLWIALKAGVAAYLCLAVAWGISVVRGLTRWRRQMDGETGAAILASSLTLLAVLIGSLTSPMIMEWFWTPAIGMLMGLNEAALRLGRGSTVKQ